MGGVDETRYEGSLTLIENVNPRGFWEGEMSTVSVNGHALLRTRTAIFDTGTTLIICPADDAEAIHAAIPGAKSDGGGGFTLPCDSQVRLSLKFGGKEFEVNTSDLKVQPVDPDDLSGDCVSGITPGIIGGPDQWLLGDVFLKVCVLNMSVVLERLQTCSQPLGLVIFSRYISQRTQPTTKSDWRPSSSNRDHRGGKDIYSSNI